MAQLFTSIGPLCVLWVFKLRTVTAMTMAAASMPSVHTSICRVVISVGAQQMEMGGGVAWILANSDDDYGDAGWPSF